MELKDVYIHYWKLSEGNISSFNGERLEKHKEYFIPVIVRDTMNDKMYYTIQDGKTKYFWNMECTERTNAFIKKYENEHGDEIQKIYDEYIEENKALRDIIEYYLDNTKAYLGYRGRYNYVETRNPILRNHTYREIIYQILYIIKYRNSEFSYDAFVYTDKKSVEYILNKGNEMILKQVEHNRQLASLKENLKNNFIL